MGMNITVVKLNIVNNATKEIRTEDGQVLVSEPLPVYYHVLAENSDIGWDRTRHFGDEEIYYEVIHKSSISEFICEDRFFRPKDDLFDCARRIAARLLQDEGCSGLIGRWDDIFNKMENDNSLWFETCDCSPSLLKKNDKNH